jgi:murein L,D-transpeptidase YcbB/YkuD
MFSVKATIGLLLLLFLGTIAGPARADMENLRQAMAEHLACYPVDLISLKYQQPSISRRDFCLAVIYGKRGNEPLWVREDGPTQSAAVMYKYLKNADKEGLEPLSYRIDEIEELWRDRSWSSLAKLDTLITYNVVKYIHEVRYGQLKPATVEPGNAETDQTSFDLSALVETLRTSSDLDRYFQSLPPANRYYNGLKKALARYNRIDRSGEWTPIGPGKNIYPGDLDRRIPQIRERLAVLAGKEKPGPTIARYDGTLEEEILLFQELHGLKTDGVVGNMTLDELNVGPDKRIAQIQINMIRWRWQDHDLGDDYILVNIADYGLYGYRGGELKLSLPVIVGKRQDQTPVFSDRIQYIVFNPFWNIPSSIAVDEDLPNLRNNPRYLLERNIRLFSSRQTDGVELDSTLIDWNQVSTAQMRRYRLRQDPGHDNALGRIKFVFPNHHSVYIHDTPSKNLFFEQDRSFSHGCIRVSEPEKLAAFILQNHRDWNEMKIGEMLRDETRKVIQVRPPFALHLTYQTAWLDKKDRIHFNRDVYGRDKKLYKALLKKKEKSIGDRKQ